ncbi:MAG: SDR family oxidoreductase [Acidobacteriota bacterium]|nr:SDR family oxidoreductase [Acidobacteriota bacterium]
MSDVDRAAAEGLEGRVAIVTGGGAAGEGIGNGRAASLLLAEAGMRVLVVDRELALADRTVEMIEASGGEAVAFEADVTRSASCEGMVEAAIGRWSSVDVLVNNVGVGSRGSVVDEPLETFQRVMRINVESMVLASKVAIPAMIEGGGGAIVNVSSISALRPRGLTSYSTSKGAVIALTKAMAADHGRDGIRVNCVAPGPVYTPLVYGRGMTPDAREGRRRASLLEVEGTGWDVGNAVRFLASARAGYITGQVVVVDGGVTVRGPSRET